MKVSVIIPSYQPGDYIWECLDSLKNQKLSKSDYEVIIVLNGCNEPYYSAIKQWIADNDCNHFILNQLDTPGVSNARNYGIDRARGEFIGFIDDDDYVSETYLSGLLKVADRDCIALAHPVAFKDTKVSVPYSIENCYNQISKEEDKIPYIKAKKFFGGPCMKLIYSGIILTGGVRFNSDYKNGEDSLFMFEASKYMHFVKCATSDVIYFRRFRDGSATQAFSLKKRVVNQTRLVIKYCQLFFKEPRSYNLYFFITRFLGAIKAMIMG